MESDLEQRQGWPQELRLLLARHPRASWSAHKGFALARFWLERHDMFRRHADALQAGTHEYLEGRVAALDHQRWLVPRLQAFIAHLHGHHQIEDHHYFPAFRAADARLASGFDVLDQDHRALHAGIATLVEHVNAFLGCADDAARRGAGERYATASARLHAQLLRHLEDEEDLIIPVMLEHGA